jgi:hypothetical protein
VEWDEGRAAYSMEKEMRKKERIFRGDLTAVEVFRAAVDIIFFKEFSRWNLLKCSRQHETKR